MRFSPSLDAIYARTEISFADRIRRVADLGYSAFEFWTWWDKDVHEIGQTAKACGIQVASLCTKFVPLVDPLRLPEYQDGLRETLAVATSLQCSFVITQVGLALPDVSRERQRHSIIDGLMQCTPLLAESGVTLLVEPLNAKIDHPGYFLTTANEGFEIIESVNSPHVRLLYDIYHQQVTEGDLVRTIARNLDKIGYLHAADHPGRGEIGTGEIHYGNILRAVSAAGYNGFVGLEYFPDREPDAGLRAFLSDFGDLEHGD